MTELEALQEQRDRLIEEIRELRSKVKNQQEILLYKFEDLVPNGRTILDFYSLWLQQEKQINAKLKHHLRKIEDLISNHRDNFVCEADLIDDIEQEIAKGF